MWLPPNLIALIVNTAAGCYSHGHALALNAVTPTCMLLLCFDKEKSKCFKSFEKCTISVAHVVNHGEMFDDWLCQYVQVGVGISWGGGESL